MREDFTKKGSIWPILGAGAGLLGLVGVGCFLFGCGQVKEGNQDSNKPKKTSKSIQQDSLPSVVEFYSEAKTDQYGRTWSQILQKDDVWLEDKHDFIQWLFPLYVKG